MLDLSVESIVSKLIILLTALPFHELAHGYVAYLLGDSTAYRMGRLTLNPFRHINITGTLMMLFVGVGFAEPVPINTRNFRYPRLYMAITAIAGPLSNILLGIVSCVLYMLVLNINSTSEFFVILSNILVISAQINAMLAAVNLMPIPPLDGSRLLGLIVPKSWSDFMASIEKYMMIIVLILFFVGAFYGPIRILAIYIFNAIFFISSVLTGNI